MRTLTLSNFLNEFALLGNHPFTASPATDTSQEGQPAATCSLADPLGTSTILKFSCILLETPIASEPSLCAPTSAVACLWCAWTVLVLSATAATFFSPWSSDRDRVVAALSCILDANLEVPQWLPLIATSIMAATTSSFFERVANRLKDLLRCTAAPSSKSISLEQMQPISRKTGCPLPYFQMYQSTIRCIHFWN